MVTRQAKAGFTLIELLVVMAIIATLLTIALPRYFSTIEHSKEQVLRSNLNTLREAIDKYYADRGRYPAKLESLVMDKYLREVPIDPMTESAQTWVVMPARESGLTGVGDVHSGAGGQGSNNIPYSEW